MVTPSKSPLRASQRQALQRLKLRRQAYHRALVLVIIIVVACVVDFWVTSHTVDGSLEHNFAIAKSVSLGAILNWFAQTVFAGFVFKYTGAPAKNNIVSYLYLGQIIKWVIVVAGFSIIFMTIKSIIASATIIGFVAMQVGHFVTLLKIR